MSEQDKPTVKGMGLVQLAGPNGQLWQLLDRKGKIRFWILLGLMIGAAAVELASLGAIQLYAALLTGREAASLPFVGPYLGDVSGSEDFVLLTGVMSIVLIVKFMIFAFVYWVMATVLASQRVRLSTRLFKAYQCAPYAWHLQRPTSDLQRNLREDVNTVINSAILPFLQLLLSVLTGMAIFSFILVALPASVMLGLALAIIPFLIISTIAHRMLVRAGSRLRDETSRTIAGIQQGLGALTEARILDRRAWFLREFRIAMVGAAAAQRTRVFLYQASPVAVETVLMVAMMIIIGIILRTAATLETALELATILAVAVFRLKQILSKATGALNKVSSATPSLKPLIDDLAELAAYENTEDRPLDADRMEFASLEFVGTSFSFPGATNPAVDNISFEVNRGDHLAVLGSTGAGKSTLISLALGLIEPSKGSVTLNGQRLSDHVGQWRREIGYVPQSIYLVDGTIASNIALGIVEGNIDRERVQTVLEMAGLADFVASLPDGIDTRSGEQGSWLSGGQRQRIGIARALYGDPTVLVLDEATSALDRQTEEAILNTLHRFDHDLTILTITHKMETVKDADTILFLANGVLVGKGSFPELMENCEPFRQAAHAGSPVQAV